MPSSPDHGLPSTIRAKPCRLLGALLLAMASSTAAIAAEPAPSSLQELDQRLAKMFAQRGIPGAALAVVEDGKVVLLKGYGVADKAGGVQVTPDTIFRAASISKSFTSIAIMQLVENGKLKLDARLADLTPEISFNNPWEQSDPVRLVHLLEHTTGWSDISARVELQNGPGWSVRRGVEFASPEYVSRWRPGQFAVYTNAGPAVAGYVLEKVAGQDFAAYEREHVLRPMGMASADFTLTPELASRLAKSYAPDGAPTPYQHIIMPPSGSLATSVRELARLVLFFVGRGTVDGQRILSPQAVARIEHGESSLAARAGLGEGYGLGNFPLSEAGQGFRGHNGEIDSFTSVYGYSAAQGSGYVVLANGGEGVDFRTPVTGLIQAYLSRKQAPSPAPLFAVEQGELAALTGFYRNVTPAKNLMRPYAEVLGMSRVTLVDGGLRIGGKPYLPTGKHTFRRADREAASLAFAVQDGETYLLSGGLGDRKREATWRIASYAVVAALALLGGVFGLLALPVWGVAAYRKTLQAKGGWKVRVMPLLAFGSLCGTFILPLIGISGGIGTMAMLAAPSLLSLPILLCSVTFPLLAAAGVWHAVRTRHASRLVRWHAGLTSAGILVIAAYAWSIGWIGMRTWTM
ncbi:serine hydrolase domain-containing protein [Duganella violaceipulchra]|uniref:CubicO group peptidase (Beta-lactamase class C family) n=2 Tax=Duganella violaceipulchra TaxID=2849652 RepID=A0ABT1GEA1_9BURK|nr:serine hydrolase domain-containing protein [Duganella violaceicalia]MCP2007275.1 CubicO group peptidase (beta-lactamase class C family) [Duganella violaceicalia]